MELVNGETTIDIECLLRLSHFYAIYAEELYTQDGKVRALNQGKEKGKQTFRSLVVCLRLPPPRAFCT